MQTVSVRPGDLIRADDFNAMFAKLQDLEERVSKLESVNPTPGAVVMDDISPATTREGDEIRIRGRNFGMAIGATRIDFNGVPPDFLKTGSSDTLLICNVPVIPDLPASGAPITVTVYNQFSSASRQIIVRPTPVTPSGVIDTLLDATQPTTITAGQDNLFQIKLRSRSKPGATLALAAEVSQAAWQPSVRILDAFEQPMTPPRVHLEPSEEKVFLVRVSIPAGTNGTAFSLTVTGVGSGVSTSSGRLDFTVGQPSTVDTSFSIAASGSSPSSALVGATITAASTGITQVNGRADFSTAGNYEVQIAPLPATAAGWTLSVIDPPADAAGKHIIRVLASEIPAGGTAQKTIQFRVRPASATTPNAQARLTVQRTGATVLRAMTFDLVAS